MSSDALKWFNKVGQHTQTAAQYVILHALCLQDPNQRPGEWFKPNLSKIGRHTPVTRQTASTYLSKLEAAGFIERLPPKNDGLKSLIRLCLEKVFSDVIEGKPNDHNVNQRRQLGVTRGDGKLSPEPTETVTSDDTTYKQEQGSGVATPQPEPDPCSTYELGCNEDRPRERDERPEISCEELAENLRFFRLQPR